MPEDEAIILFFDLSIQVKKTNDLVFLSIETTPIISSLYLVGLINFFSKVIVTHGLWFAQ